MPGAPWHHLMGGVNTDQKEKQKGGQLTVRDLLVRASRVGEFREVTWPLRASYLCEDLGGRGGSGRSA